MTKLLFSLHSTRPAVSASNCQTTWRAMPSSLPSLLRIQPQSLQCIPRWASLSLMAKKALTLLFHLLQPSMARLKQEDLWFKQKRCSGLMKSKGRIPTTRFQKYKEAVLKTSCLRTCKTKWARLTLSRKTSWWRIWEQTSSQSLLAEGALTTSQGSREQTTVPVQRMINPWLRSQETTHLN